ncbi:unnamed protein product [Lactuca virosa]|uniref:Uncharacterized protein n=1 Tax=Lactuca virosa TaxID=75947 RepID=A0AAU9PPW0_9ASTR|nr:unnamed protein product [Lactuca virosa]
MEVRARRLGPRLIVINVPSAEGTKAVLMNCRQSCHSCYLSCIELLVHDRLFMCSSLRLLDLTLVNVSSQRFSQVKWFGFVLHGSTFPDTLVRTVYRWSGFGLTEPLLFGDNQSIVDQLVANYVKWYDPDDSILEHVGLEGVPNVVDKPPDLALRGQSNTLLELLLSKSNTPYPKVVDGPTTRSETPVEGEAVLEFESSIDSHAQPKSGVPAVISSSPSDKRKKRTIVLKGSFFVELPFSFLNVTELVLQWFTELTNFDFTLLKMLEGDGVDASFLNKQLEGMDSSNIRFDD